MGGLLSHSAAMAIVVFSCRQKPSKLLRADKNDATLPRAVLEVVWRYVKAAAKKEEAGGKKAWKFTFIHSTTWGKSLAMFNVTRNLNRFFTETLVRDSFVSPEW